MKGKGVQFSTAVLRESPLDNSFPPQNIIAARQPLKIPELNVIGRAERPLVYNHTTHRC